MIKGLLPRTGRRKKDAFYFYKAKWSNEPVVYITSRRFTERTDPNTTVKIYSNCDSVELKVNGQSFGSRTEKSRVFKWFDVRLQPGQNIVEATATRDGKQYTDKCEWTVTIAAEPNLVNQGSI
jgi:beta-galactosidase